MRESDVDEDDAGGGIGDDDALDGEPKEELLLWPPDDVGELAVAELAPHDAFEVGEVVVVAGVAGASEADLEEAGGEVEGEVLDAPWEEAAGEALAAEELPEGAATTDEDVPGGDGAGGKRWQQGREGEEGQKEEERRRLCHWREQESFNGGFKEGFCWLKFAVVYEKKKKKKKKGEVFKEGFEELK